MLPLSAAMTYCRQRRWPIASARALSSFFRYGAAVMIGLTPAEQDEELNRLRLCVSGPFTPPEDESGNP